MRINDARLDYFINEDVPYIDLTTEILGIGGAHGEMEFFTREDCVLCGTEESARMASRLGCEVKEMLPSGTPIEARQAFMTVAGSADDLHAAWKVCLNMVDSTSAVSTKAHAMVEKVHAANPSCEVLTTRKVMPGTKDLMMKAIMVGGAFPHRLGLSETILIFDHHITFMGGFDAFLADLPRIKRCCIEKKLFVEATAQRARVLAKAGVDGIQFDKMPVEELAALVEELRGINPHITLIGAGGINLSNAAEYAATGIDGIATTCLYNAKPLDMSVRMRMV